MSTAATAAYQAAQVESGIWLSQRARRDSRGDGKRGKGGRGRRGEGTAPKHPCVYVRSLARFPHPPGGTRVRFTSSLLPRETPRAPSLPLLPCASVIMCSHIGVPAEHRGGQCGGGEEHRELRWVEREPRGASPLDLEVDRIPCTYGLDSRMCE